MKKTQMGLRGFISVLCLLLWGTSELRAQRDAPLFSQQIFSSINFNPAAVPVRDEIQASLFGRHQWLGFTGAPNTAMLNLQGYIDEIKSGIGATITADAFGKSCSLNAKFSYSYHFHLGASNYLSLGLSAGILYKNFRGSQLIVDQNGDPAISMEDVNDIKPDLDFGLAFTSAAFSMGVSATHLISFAYSQKDYYTPQMGLYLFATYEGKVSEKVLLQPYVRAYYVGFGGEGTFKFEIDFRAEFLKAFWIGTGYRYNDAIKVMGGVTIAKIFSVGYCYDIGISSIKSFNSGSHELMLSLRLPTAKKIGQVTETPRYFGEDGAVE